MNNICSINQKWVREPSPDPFGLDLYDYGFRQYDPVVPMFTQQDPLAEKYYHLSPYVYCGNNPVNVIDPTGMDIWDIDTEGNITNYVKTEDYDMIRIINENGKYSASVKFNYGTVYHQSIKYGPNSTISDFILNDR